MHLYNFSKKEQDSSQTSCSIIVFGWCLIPEELTRVDQNYNYVCAVYSAVALSRLSWFMFLSGYDSGSHSPPSSATTPPHMLEDNDMSGSSTGETTPPVIQVQGFLCMLLQYPAGLVQWWSTCLPPMWPGFDSRTRRHMWAEFVGSLLCSERFFSGYSGFSPLSKTNI